MTNIRESRHCSNIKIEDECSFLPHLLPNLPRETCRRIESEVQSFWRNQELGIMDRIVVYGKDWRRARSGSWWTEPLDFFSRHEAGIINLHTLCLHVGKLSLQNTGICRLTVSNEKLGLRSQLRSGMCRSFYELVAWKFQGQGIGGSIWLSGTKMRCSGVLHDGL